MSTPLEQAREYLSKPQLIATAANGVQERYEQFAVQETFNTTGMIVQLSTRLSNYEGNRSHREKIDGDNSHVSITTKRGKPKHKSSSENINPSKLIDTHNICLCCGMRGHTRNQCHTRDRAECFYCKMKSHLVHANRNKTRESQDESLASSLILDQLMKLVRKQIRIRL